MSNLAASRFPWLADAWGHFLRLMDTGRLPHALIVDGPEGIGKSCLALDMVASALCLGPLEGEACGGCRSCQLLHGGAHPDYFPVRPRPGKHQIVIDDVRSAIGLLGLTTTISRRKVALLEPAEAMNRNAANALLKNLEEPPGDALLLLVSHNPSRLPVTIRSRCQSLHCHLPEATLARQWLGAELGLADADARQALDAAAHSPLRAAGLHRQSLVALHRELGEELRSLGQHPARVAALAMRLKDLEPDILWMWLSGLAATRMRQESLSGAPDVSLSGLQRRADRYKGLARTSVRGDLLLRDWLIEWSRLGSGKV